MQDTILTAFLLLQVKFGRNIKAQFINYLKSEVCHKELGANFSKIKQFLIMQCRILCGEAHSVIMDIYLPLALKV